MTHYEKRGTLSVSKTIANLVEKDILPGTDVSADQFWGGLEKTLSVLGPRTKSLIKKRDDIQEKLDNWLIENRQKDIAMETYKDFLRSIDYLVEDQGDFEITTSNVDAEIATIAGPQLVVPVMNARFALNAANARWGSLYDALYGTDAVSDEGDLARTKGFNVLRANKVIEQSMAFLDQACPLDNGSHKDVVSYTINEIGTPKKLIAHFKDGSHASLKDLSQFAGYVGTGEPDVILLQNNGLHIELHIDRADTIGKHSAAGVKDVVLESALTTIQDCEDSVAAVDAEDKAVVYGNWLGLMKGDLKESFEKGGKTVERKLNEDRSYTDTNGNELTLPGRSLLLVRNVGHLMTNDAILDGEGNEIPEGIMDGFITVACALHDFKRKGNSRTGSVYIVKPKMHGPEEVALTNDLFKKIEETLYLPANTIKVGVMDEERRTTVNLKECIRQVKDRIVFINTGFLDRTGDEIHTSMEAGLFLPKEDIKGEPWIAAYENWNVDVGLSVGFSGKAQIGKGMWPKPDEMAQMMEVKGAHPKAGANCAWVPSPTAATLHVTHYHELHVLSLQEGLKTREFASVDDILTVPLLGNREVNSDQVQAELDNNAQGILGYVVRWIDQGIGCSKVPDINNVGLMEDRATLRISAQHIANWLRHGLCTDVQVMETMKRMAAVVDEQNGADPLYKKMSDDFDASIAFKAACDLVFLGCAQPNGYTEPILHRRRKELKAQVAKAQGSSEQYGT